MADASTPKEKTTITKKSQGSAESSSTIETKLRARLGDPDTCRADLVEYGDGKLRLILPQRGVTSRLSLVISGDQVTVE